MKRIMFFTIIIICVISIIHSISSIATLLKKQDLLIKAQDQLQISQKKNKKLKEESKLVQEQSFIEEEARNKLFMVKPGENTIIIPKGLIVSRDSGAVHTSIQKPNWQQWIGTFFY